MDSTEDGSHATHNQELALVPALPHTPLEDHRVRSVAGADADEMNWVPRCLVGQQDVCSTAAALSLTVALAAAQAGGLPSNLLHLISPFRSQHDELRVLGKGGFGSVSLVRSRLDRRLLAVKAVRFTSSLPPWTPPQALEKHHDRLLREVRALAALSWSPHVVQYHAAWIEPDWPKLGNLLLTQSKKHPALKQLLNAAKASPVSPVGLLDPYYCLLPPGKDRPPVVPPTSASAASTPGSYLQRSQSDSGAVWQADPRGNKPVMYAGRPAAWLPGTQEVPSKNASNGLKRAQKPACIIKELGASRTQSSASRTSRDARGLTRSHSSHSPSQTSCSEERETECETSSSESGSNSSECESSTSESESGSLSNDLSSEPTLDDAGLSFGSDTHLSAFTFASQSSQDTTSLSVSRMKAAGRATRQEQQQSPFSIASMSSESKGSQDSGSLSGSETDTSSSSSESEESEEASDEGKRDGTGMSNLQALVPWQGQDAPWRGMHAAPGNGAVPAPIRRRHPQHADTSSSGSSSGGGDRKHKRSRHQRHRQDRRAGLKGGDMSHGKCDLLEAAGISRWPHVLYIMMEPVPGLTLDVWLRQRVEHVKRMQREAAEAGTPWSSAMEGGLGPIEQDIFMQLVLGLSHVHGEGIIHRDVKPSNIFITPRQSSVAPPAYSSVMTSPRMGRQPSTPQSWHTAQIPTPRTMTRLDSASTHIPMHAAASFSTQQPSKVHVKLGDFGLSVLLEGMAEPSLQQEGRQHGYPGGFSRAGSTSSGSASLGQSHTSGIGTASYAAPEQISGPGPHGQSADMYPLGLILLELAQPLDTGMERAHAMHEARQGRLPPSLVRWYPREASLILSLLHTNPAMRPTCSELLQILHTLWYAPAESGLKPATKGVPSAFQHSSTHTAVQECSVDSEGGVDGMVVGVGRQLQPTISLVSTSTEATQELSTHSATENGSASLSRRAGQLVDEGRYATAKEQQVHLTLSIQGRDSHGSQENDSSIERDVLDVGVQTDECCVGQQAQQEGGLGARAGQLPGTDAPSAEVYEYKGQLLTGRELLQLLHLRDAELAAVGR